MTILVDMDDVLADFDGEMYRLWKEKHPDKYIVPPLKGRTFISEKKCLKNMGI